MTIQKAQQRARDMRMPLIRTIQASNREGAVDEISFDPEQVSSIVDEDGSTTTMICMNSGDFFSVPYNVGRAVAEFISEYRGRALIGIDEEESEEAATESPVNDGWRQAINRCASLIERFERAPYSKSAELEIAPGDRLSAIVRRELSDPDGSSFTLPYARDTKSPAQAGVTPDPKGYFLSEVECAAIQKMMDDLLNPSNPLSSDYHSKAAGSTGPINADGFDLGAAQKIKNFFSDIADKIKARGNKRT